MAVALQIGGYLFLRGDHTSFGWAMFIAVPFVSGFAVAAIVRRPWRVAACCAMSAIATFSVLLFTGWEGIVCCIMSLPLVGAAVAVGALLGYFIRGKWLDQMPSPDQPVAILLLLCPLLIAAADRIERPTRNTVLREVFTTTVTVPATPERTWELIAEMEKLDGPRPFLLRVGLPVPTKCQLEKSAVGGKRICYFDQGEIRQEVTEWNHPETMILRVTGSSLPGRHWLSFIDAGYQLTTENGQTTVLRHTTIGTKLYPRWYWRPLEKWGVTSEHRFVFSNLQRWTTTIRPTQ